MNIISEITAWLDDLEGPHVYRLVGRPGSGKSTIARTVCKFAVAKNQLGASFSFKRGEKHRGNTEYLAASVAYQLSMRQPVLAASVRAMVEDISEISRTNLTEQFERLIWAPLHALDADYSERNKEHKKMILLVFDGLDEFDEKDRLRIINYQIRHAKKFEALTVKILVTSSVDERHGQENSPQRSDDEIFHSVSEGSLRHDISLYILSQLSDIRKTCNHRRIEKPLQPGWPGLEDTQALLEMVGSSFVAATTACRFISKSIGDPEDNLEKLLSYKNRSVSEKYDRSHSQGNPIYSSILLHCLDASSEPRDAAMCQLKDILGTIALLVEPLSVSSLSGILEMKESDIRSSLQWLSACIHVPTSSSSPIRILHTLFTDFLLSNTSENDLFKIDKSKAHEGLGLSLLTLLTSQRLLNSFMSDSMRAWTTGETDNTLVFTPELSANIQYAVSYWAHHLMQSRVTITDDHPVHAFLTQYFLQWVTALSILGKLPEAIYMVTDLQSLLNVSF